MSVTTPDRIERSIVIRAPRTRVWSALTDAGAIGQWFGTGARLDLRAGGDFSLDFAVYPTSHARIVAVEPPGRFAFRWQAMGPTPPRRWRTGQARSSSSRSPTTPPAPA